MLYQAVSHILKMAATLGNITLHFVASTLQCIKNSTLYADLPVFLSPCILTGDLLRPDLFLCIGTATIYIVEPIVGFETNITTKNCSYI